MSTNPIRRVAILGAGVMGAQIAAHCINTRIPVILFDLETPTEGGESAYKIISNSINALKKLKPAPLGLPEDAELIRSAHYGADLPLLSECDLVIEAISERMDWKHDLYKKVIPHLKENVVFATNTSGLSITELSTGFPKELQSRFCGVHFFNPPRYMHLLELIPTAQTDPVVVDQLETWMTTVMGKGVVRAKDTPNFVGNRVGVFSILAVFAEAQKFNLSIDTVDALTGNKLGRPKSATFRTADVVGLDTLAHVIKTMETSLPTDSFVAIFKTPSILQKLVAKGFLGQKSKQGFYKKVRKDIFVFDEGKQDYVPCTGLALPIIERILKKPIGERIELLRETQDDQAQFLWSIYRDIFHYIAVHLGSIAQSAREVDLAMRWGFGWSQGPFEDWQEAGWLKIAAWIEEDIANGKTLSQEPLPAWVTKGEVARRGGVHQPEGSWSAEQNKYLSKSTLPVYARQLFPPPLFGDASVAAQTAGETVFENSDIRVWINTAWVGFERVLIATFKTKMNTLSPDVLEGIERAITLAETDYEGLVIWQSTSLQLGNPGGPFSAGANLEKAMPMVMKSGPSGVEPFVKAFQDTMMRVKYAQVPVVCAVSGIALGGGCELLLHAAKRVAHIESYIGLVEIGVGLLPAGGGVKEAAIRAHQMVNSMGNQNYLDALKFSFENIAMAKVSSSAQEAVKMNYLKDSDILVSNVHELLFCALSQVKALHASSYRPPLRRKIPVAGRSVAATFQSQLINMRDGGFISEHDAFIAEKIAHVITGGDLEPGTLVSEEWLLTQERRAFIELIGTTKTMERVMSILQTGKPLRN